MPVTPDASAPTVRVNGVPLSSYGAAVVELSGWLDGRRLTRARTALPGRAGSLGAFALEAEARQAAVRVLVGGSTVADRTATLRALLRAHEGELRITTDDVPGYVMRAELSELSFEPFGDPLLEPALIATLVYTGLDNVRYAEEFDAVALSTVPAPIPVGSAPSAALLYAYGPTSAPLVVRQRDARRALVAELTYSANLEAGTFLRLDLTTRRAGVVTASSGAVADAEADVSGSYPVLSPAYGATLDRDDPNARQSLVLSASRGVLYTRRAEFL